MTCDTWDEKYVLRAKTSELSCYSNKNTQLDATINRKIYYFVVQTLLNMFRALLCPSSGDRQTAVVASGFPMNVEVEVFSAVVGLLVIVASRWVFLFE